MSYPSATMEEMPGEDPGLLGSSPAADLREDTLATWSPDVAAWADLPHYEGEPRASYVAQRLSVPRPNNTPSDVRILHPAWHMALHRACLPLRDAAAKRLSPGVFGYRLGASSEHRYADSWRLFCEFVSDRAEECPYMVVTDVKAFFPSTSWGQILDSARPLVGKRAHGDLAKVIAALEAGGCSCLPTGYGDARMLANLVLAKADAQVRVPFARWVDDYRLFAQSEGQAQAALRDLEDALAQAGLQVNRDKTRIIRSDRAAERRHRDLDEAYRPKEHGPDEIVRRLMEVLAEVKSNPLACRRQLRFVLPRLAKQKDDVAVPFAFEGLETLPWDAPRLVGYLSAFTETHDMASETDKALLRAAQAQDAWMLCRLAPLAARVGLSSEAIRALGDVHASLEGTPAWALVMRLLALSGEPPIEAMEVPGGDARAVLVASKDAAIPCPRWASEAEPVLASVLADGPAPPLVTESLL
jgi:hypothetical protein